GRVCRVRTATCAADTHEAGRRDRPRLSVRPAQPIRAPAAQRRARAHGRPAHRRDRDGSQPARPDHAPAASRRQGRMTRPRFHRLSAEQQAAILDAALTEFSTHGYRDASLNRIIDSAGISKGSMYYYFDDKEDLYAHVIRRQLEALVQQGGPIPVPDAQ